jgi:hypothetical protein
VKKRGAHGFIFQHCIRQSQGKNNEIHLGCRAGKSGPQLAAMLPASVENTVSLCCFFQKILSHTDNALKAAIPWISAFYHLQETV